MFFTVSLIALKSKFQRFYTTASSYPGHPATAINLGVSKDRGCTIFELYLHSDSAFLLEKVQEVMPKCGRSRSGKRLIDRLPKDLIFLDKLMDLRLSKFSPKSELLVEQL